MRRRVVFATPFVVVVGCGQPASPPVGPTVGKVEDARRVEAIDAAVVAEALPDVPDKPPLDALDNGRCIPHSGHPCNPPRPDAGAPPRVLDAHVIDAHHTADGMIFTARLEGHDGVTKDFTGVFVDEQDAPISGTEFVIQVPNYQVLCLLPGRDQLPSKRVRFYEAPRSRT